MGEAVFAGIGLDQVDQLFDGPCRQRGVDEKGVRGVRSHRLVRVIRHLGEEAWIDHVARRRKEDRITVSCGARRVAHADVAAGADLVFDIKLPAEILRQVLCDEARDHVAPPARGERYYDAHRPRRVGLRPRGSGGGRESASAGDQSQEFTALKSHLTAFPFRISDDPASWRIPARRGSRFSASFVFLSAASVSLCEYAKVISDGAIRGWIGNCCICSKTLCLIRTSASCVAAQPSFRLHPGIRSS